MEKNTIEDNPQTNADDIHEKGDGESGDEKVDGEEQFKNLATQVTTDQDNREADFSDWLEYWAIFDMLQKRTSRADYDNTNIKGHLQNKLRYFCFNFL